MRGRLKSVAWELIREPPRVRLEGRLVLGPWYDTGTRYDSSCDSDPQRERLSQNWQQLKNWLYLTEGATTYFLFSLHH